MFDTVIKKKLCLMDFCVPLLVLVAVLLFVFRDKVMSFLGINKGGRDLDCSIVPDKVSREACEKAIKRLS